MPRKTLVATTDAGDIAAVRVQVERAAGGETPDVRVVVPAAKLSPLRWLASDEDDARREAAREAQAAADAFRALPRAKWRP